MLIVLGKMMESNTVIARSGLGSERRLRDLEVSAASAESRDTWLGFEVRQFTKCTSDLAASDTKTRAEIDCVL